MKKVKIAWDVGKSPSFCYASSQIKFCWLSSAVKGIYPQVSTWHACRETFAGELAARERGHWRYKRKLNLRRLRYAVIRRGKAGTFKSIDAWMKRGKNILNVFEKHMGWALSKIYAVDWEEADKVPTKIYVISATPKWARSPQLLSLHLLLLRCGKYTEFDKLTEIDDLPAIAKTLKSRRRSGDARYVIRDHAKWRKIIDNVDYLFVSRKMATMFRQNESYHGIQSLCNSNAGDYETRQRYSKVMSMRKEK